MSELIKAAINIKDPFTLLAFFAVIVLIAFRTKSVPESRTARYNWLSSP